MGPEEFRRAGHELVDWVADYRLRVAGLPVRAQVAPGEVLSALAPCPPEAPEPLSALIADLDRVIVPGLTHTQHPEQFRLVPLQRLAFLCPGRHRGGWPRSLRPQLAVGAGSHRVGAARLRLGPPALRALGQLGRDDHRRCVDGLPGGPARGPGAGHRQQSAAGRAAGRDGAFDGLLFGGGAFVGDQGRSTGRLRCRQPAPGPRAASRAGRWTSPPCAP